MMANQEETSTSSLVFRSTAVYLCELPEIQTFGSVSVPGFVVIYPK